MYLIVVTQIVINSTAKWGLYDGSVLIIDNADLHVLFWPDP